MTALLDAAALAERMIAAIERHGDLRGFFHATTADALRLLAKHARECTMAPSTLDGLARITDGYGAITFDEFAASLKETIGADREYAERCWIPFRDNPIGYCRVMSGTTCLTPAFRTPADRVPDTRAKARRAS
ncbi:MAG TPA: hypothetical protein VHL34_07140 [Rhizomicrobium sp.]|nr:hypothetical protein [Rhizomicrobium sp.]